MNITVTLSWPEIIMAAQIGCMRRINALRNSRSPNAGIANEDSWSADIEGAAGEMAVAKYLNTFWSGTIGSVIDDDVGPYQVRTSMNRNRDSMILRPRDSDEKIWIAVRSFLPNFIICGWIKGKDGKLPEYLGAGSFGRPPWYFVPQSALNPMIEIRKAA